MTTAPYQTVTISGSGWQPGEKVHLRVSEDADTHTDWELEAIADEFGNIVNREFYPRNDEVYHHIGMRFYLTAVGIGSQALTTFTDAMQTETLLTSSMNPSLATQSVTFTATVRMNDKKGNTDNWKPAVGGSVEFYDRTTAQDACDKQNGNYGSLLGTSPVNAGQASLGHTFSSGGSYPIMACYKGTGGNDGTQNSASPQITQTVNSAVADTTTIASNASATFSASNQNVTLSATVSQHKHGECGNRHVHGEERCGYDRLASFGFCQFGQRIRDLCSSCKHAGRDLFDPGGLQRRHQLQQQRRQHQDTDGRPGQPGRGDGFGTTQCDIPADGIVGCRIGRQRHRRVQL